MKSTKIVIWLAAALTLLVILFPISRQRDPEKREKELVQERLGGIAYIRDARPNPPICYAINQRSGFNGPMVVVPCESVEHLIEQK